ncbi:MAG: hypothetical protein NT079_02510 [Candidatus Omnitrophica bacterium]|nr:hypothetical protein [Candidatus Omnitrophota bacterium]
MVKKIKNIESNHSLKSRYLYKILGNAVNLFSGMIVQMVVPRGLGAFQYGNFSFLTDFFTQFMAFFNMGSSVGFYTKLSKRQKESKLVVFYIMYIFLIVGIGFLTVFVFSHFGLP